MSRIRTYISEVFLELRKATWPWDPKEKGFAKYKELNDSTIMVFVAMLLLGAFVFFLRYGSCSYSFQALNDWASR